MDAGRVGGVPQSGKFIMNEQGRSLAGGSLMVPQLQLLMVSILVLTLQIQTRPISPGSLGSRGRSK